MSDNREFDMVADSILKASRPAQDDQDPAEWSAHLGRLFRVIYRAGGRAALNRSYGARQDPIERVRWLADMGFALDDVRELLAEAESAREQQAAFQGMYGLTESALHSMLGEGFHTAFRKASDHPFAITIHQLIRDLPPEEWKAVLDFVTEPIADMLREAEAHQNQERS